MPFFTKLARRFCQTARWSAVLIALLFLSLALGLLGAAYQAIATALGRRAFAPPGQLVDVGGYRLHINCIGQGRPTVILESGLANPSSIWGWVQPEVAHGTRVCAYDRTGVGWSDAGPEPRDGQQIARELHTLLDRANIPGPYVLVGHSVGGLYVRVYAAQYPQDVAGMVLIDAEHPNQWTQSPEGLAQFQSYTRLNRGLSVLAHMGVIRALDFFPVNPDLPPESAAAFKAFVDTTQFADVNATEFAAQVATDAQVRSAGLLGAIPLVVLTAPGGHGFPLAQAAALEQIHQANQRELARLSSNSVQRIVDGATHSSLQIKRAEAQITSAAILQVVAAVRTGQPLAR
jgi:pimeloyl-ACP methyl ester carboxylesterase